MPAVDDDPAAREFVVVACDGDGRGAARRVEATSHEEAVTLVAATATLTDAGVVYEVCPAQEPGAVLRVTLRPPGVRRPIA